MYRDTADVVPTCWPVHWLQGSDASETIFCPFDLSPGHAPAAVFFMPRPLLTTVLCCLGDGL